MLGLELPPELTLSLALGASGIALSALGLALSRRPDALRRSLAYLALGLLASALAASCTAESAGHLSKTSTALDRMAVLSGQLGDQLIESMAAAPDPELLLLYARARYVDSGVRVNVVDADGSDHPFEPSDEERRTYEGLRLLRDAYPRSVRTLAILAALAPLLSGVLTWLALWRSRLSSPAGAAAPRA